MLTDVCLKKDECIQRCRNGALVCSGCAPGYHLNEVRTGCEGKKHFSMFVVYLSFLHSCC